MKEVGRYNTDLKLFEEKLGPIRMDRLLFQRWLVDTGRGEHKPVSAPAGDLALAVKVLQPIEQRAKDIAQSNVGRD